MNRKMRVLAAAGAVVLVLGGVAVVALTTLAPAATTGPHLATTSHLATTADPATPSPVMVLTAAQIAALPEAKYSAVIPGLIAYVAASASAETTVAYTLPTDTAIYGAGHATPVARFSASNFLGQPSVVVPVTFEDGWALVLTPARQALPSASAGNAPAQTAGWVRVDTLTKDHPLTQRIIVSLRAQTLTIEDATGTKTASFSVGVGTSETPTPTGVTGYIQARYLDPAQGQNVYPINLSSLHSATADEPYGGKDGGLIGVHYFNVHSGAVSHGCLRLPKDAITAVNKVPLGTPISITD